MTSTVRARIILNAIGKVKTRILHKMHINKQLLCFLYNISFGHSSISKPWIPVTMINSFYRCPVVRVVGSLSPAAPCVWPILAPPPAQPSTPRKIKQVGLSHPPSLSLSLSLSLLESLFSLCLWVFSVPFSEYLFLSVSLFLPMSFSLSLLWVYLFSLSLFLLLSLSPCSLSLTLSLSLSLKFSLCVSESLSLFLSVYFSVYLISFSVSLSLSLYLSNSVSLFHSFFFSHHVIFSLNTNTFLRKNKFYFFTIFN